MTDVKLTRIIAPTCCRPHQVRRHAHGRRTRLSDHSRDDRQGPSLDPGARPGAAQGGRRPRRLRLDWWIDPGRSRHQPHDHRPHPPHLRRPGGWTRPCIGVDHAPPAPASSRAAPRYTWSR